MLQMLKRGTTPEVVYAVDNLAMDQVSIEFWKFIGKVNIPTLQLNGVHFVHWQVSVFPDGELHVKAVKQRNKGKWSSRLSTTGTTRTPSVMSYKPPGSPHQHTTHPHTPRTPLKPKAQETIEPEPTTPYRYLYPDKFWDKSLHCHHDFAKDWSSRTRGSDQAVSQQQAPQGHPQCSLAILTHTHRGLISNPAPHRKPQN